MSGRTTGKDLVIDLDEDGTTNTGAGAIINEDAAPGTGAVDDGVIDEDVDPLDKLPKHAVKNADGSVTLPLYEEVTLQTRKDGKVRERVFTDLTFHRLRGADQRAIAAAEEKDMAVVSFARSTRINQAVMNALFDRLDASDINYAGRVLNHFLSSGPRTGR
ncbi:hypothetical protein [Hoeflea sp.]|uniref:hypothetical protein n=1 Tax=Hoeflea sp. TaxID=1940281 RepID=UPI003A92B483